MEAVQGQAELPAKVLVIAGATAAGKSAAAIGLAEAFEAEIVGADSRQIYRFMEVGTAKPDVNERARVPHHLIDVADPVERWDAARWRDEALAALRGIQGRGKRAIVCGGTGLYLRSLERGLFQGPAADWDLRGTFEAEERAEPGILHRRLAGLDAESAQRIHPNDHGRVIRALEVFELSGRTLSAWHAEHQLADRPFETLVVHLGRDREELYLRIQLRSEEMVAAGLVEETRMLRERFGAGAPGLDAIGYCEAAAVLDGSLSEANLVGALAQSTRHYAKRQRTWLRGQAQAVELGADDFDSQCALAAQFFS